MPPRRKKNEDSRDYDQKMAILEKIHRQLIPVLQSCAFHGTLLNRLTGGGIAMEESPNLLFYGSRGMPLEYMAYGLFPEFYKWLKQECEWQEKLPYFDYQGQLLEIQCRHPEFLKHVEGLCDFLKMILTTRCMYQSKYIILLRDIEVLAQSEICVAFRVLLERYSNNVLFIATTHCLSKIEPPLKSRFMLLRVPQPTQTELLSLSNGIPCNTLLEALMLKESAPIAPSAVAPVAPVAPEILRNTAYKTFQSGISFPEYCKSLLIYIQQASDPPLKAMAWLVEQLATLDVMRTHGNENGGRDPIYFEKALWLTTHINTLSK